MLHQYLAQSGGKEKILGGLDEFWNAFPPGIADTLQRDFFLNGCHVFLYICVCVHTHIQLVSGNFFCSKIKGVTDLLFLTTTAKFQGALCLKWLPAEGKSDADTRTTPSYHWPSLKSVLLEGELVSMRSKEGCSYEVAKLSFPLNNAI